MQTKKCTTCKDDFARNKSYSNKQWSDARYCCRKCVTPHSKHGKTSHPLYHVWQCLKDRCLNERATAYKDYGGRGIGVCKEWRHGFMPFYEWAIVSGWEEGLQIDREDNDKGYSSGNCRFVTSKINHRNRRGNRILEYNGESKPLIEWAEQFGIGKTTLKERLNRGWSIDDSLTRPITPASAKNGEMVNPKGRPKS